VAYWRHFSAFLASWSLLLSPAAAQWPVVASRADSPMARQQASDLAEAAAHEARLLLPYLLAQGMIHCIEVGCCCLGHPIKTGDTGNFAD
jgi:hypothetical protein